MKLDETTLVAYVDGELDAKTAREVEMALARDPRAQETVKALRESAAMVRAAFNDPLHQEVPSRLMAYLSEPENSEPSEPGGQARPLGHGRVARYVLPLAASLLALMVGFGGGYVLFGLTEPYTLEVASGEDMSDEGHIGNAIYRALEAGASGQEFGWRDTAAGRSGTVVARKGFETSTGQTCREFRSRINQGTDSRTRYGLGCRNADGSWETLWLEPRSG